MFTLRNKDSTGPPLGKTAATDRSDHHESESWEPAARPPALAPGDVHAWSVALDVPPARHAFLAGLLAPDEARRAERFRFPQHRDRYAVGRGTLRLLLAAYCGRPAAELRFVYGARGKPALEAGGVEFNLAHAEGRALVAVTSAAPVGIDLEEVVAAPDLDDVAATHFAALERQQLAALPQAERLAAFYRIWTRKEAYLKAVGDGLAAPLQHFTVSLERDRPALLGIDGDASAAATWTMAHLEPWAGHVGALASPAPLRVRRLALIDPS